MNNSSTFTVKLISYLGWVLTVLGGVFAVWAFVLILSLENGASPMVIFFFFIFIFCSIAIGQFFVVLNVIVTKLHNIETNTNAVKELLASSGSNNG
jgi:hypothetical protein